MSPYRGSGDVVCRCTHTQLLNRITNMNRASPKDIRRALNAAQVLLDAGINFVPMPVRDADHRAVLMAQGTIIFEELIAEAEKEEANDNS